MRQVFGCRVNRDWCVLVLCTSSTSMCICSIKYCVFVQYNEWSTCNNVSFRRRVNMGFCIPPLSPFCSARPENCTQLGRNRILVLLCICEPTCVDLCTIVRVFVYEFLPSRIMVAKTTRLVTRAQYRSVVNVLDNARHTAEELPWLHILDDRIVNFKPNLLRVQMQIVLQERRMFSRLPYLIRWGGRIISSLGSKIPPQNQKG